MPVPAVPPIVNVDAAVVGKNDVAPVNEEVPLKVVVDVPAVLPIPIVVVDPVAPAVAMFIVCVLPVAVIPFAILIVCATVD